MTDEYYIVSSSILPDYIERVLMARDLLKTGAVKEVSEAAKRCGISRSTYYKYKDKVFRVKKGQDFRTVVISMRMNHERGTLGRVLSFMGEEGANIVTISQIPPISGHVSVMVSIDVSELKTDIPMLIEKLKTLPGVENPVLMDMA